jgi:hypothetical protein
MWFIAAAKSVQASQLFLRRQPPLTGEPHLKLPITSWTD